MTKIGRRVVVVGLAGGLAMAQGPAIAGEYGSQKDVLGAQARRDVEQMRDISRHYARQQIGTAVNDSTRGNHRVTSTDREGALASRAHDRGAVDIVTPYTGTSRQYEQARDISARLGSHYNVVVEEAHRPARGAAGPSADVHHTYSNGYEGRTRAIEPRATGNHTHVQPNYGIDIPQTQAPWIRSTGGRAQ